MRDSSAAFARTIGSSHRMVSRADVLLNRVVIAEGIAMTSGQISYDRTAARLARLSLKVADPLRIPATSQDILTPFGYELLVWRGVQLPAGPELVPLGVFPIQVSSADGVTLLSSITAEDRSRLVSDARFEDDYSIAPGQNYATAIQTMIAAGVSGLTFLFPSTSFTTPLLTFSAQDDRWEKAQLMAKSIGMELLFDGLGRCVMRSEPSFNAAPVATIAEGVNMTAATVELSRESACNRVIATSRNAASGAVFRGVATDNDPSSPTYYLGPFGKKPRFFSSEFLASNTQCAAAAASILKANIGVSRSVDFSALPDPRLECSDVVQITRTPLGLDDLHIIETLSIGLGADSTMSATTRAQQVAT